MYSSDSLHTEEIVNLSYYNIFISSGAVRIGYPISVPKKNRFSESSENPGLEKMASNHPINRKTGVGWNV